jgi:RNA polymerase sigma-70 factor (sigma-E family)
MRGRTATQAFEEYAAVRGPALVRFAFLLLHDQHLAQDLAQEGLARAHRNWSRVQSADNPDAFVRRIMLNQLLSWRRRRSWTERPTDRPPDAPAEPTYESGDRDEMWVLLGQLPPRQRAVLVLRFYEDLTDDEIANILNCAPATVRSHASKALARLRCLVVAETDTVIGG